MQTCPQTIGAALAGVSRQRRYQIRRLRQGLCPICGSEAPDGYLCPECRGKERGRRVTWYRRRRAAAGDT